MHSETATPTPVTFWQMTILALSVLVLLIALADSTLILSDETARLLEWIDTGICAVFLGDFFWNLARAKDRMRFLRWGWIDFISSLPGLPLLRWGRMVRVVRIFRVLRALRSARTLLTFLYANKARGALACAGLTTLVLALCATVAILNIEAGAPGANIRTAPDAVWWALTTLSTVGYGEYFPVTAAGRAVALLLMVSGIGLVGVFTGYVAFFFVSEDARDEETRHREMLEKIRVLEEKLDRLGRDGK